jgi:galactonate dehydratase
LATGERLFTRHGFRELLEQQAVAVVQPDLCHAGGISEGRKIAAFAETYYVGVAPHNPLGPISTAACLQLDAVIPNFVIQELAHLGDGILREPFRIEEGHIPVPSRPGLGIEVDVDAVRALGFEDWDNPVLHARDGSLRDW